MGAMLLAGRNADWLFERVQIKPLADCERHFQKEKNPEHFRVCQCKGKYCIYSGADNYNNCSFCDTSMTFCTVIGKDIPKQYGYGRVTRHFSGQLWLKPLLLIDIVENHGYNTVVW